jgi:hypothetical protein
MDHANEVMNLAFACSDDNRNTFLGLKEIQTPRC